MTEFLFDKLMEYSKTDFYPFHMPGHKRRAAFPNPFGIDITEIDGFDNLHHAEGILKESMEWASSVYGSDRTYYLVNGSSCGILSAICGTTTFGGRILMARNSHKSAYHGVFLNHLQVEYIYPQYLGKYWVQSGLLTENIEEIVDKYDDIQAVFVVSPTYEGIVSNIEKISQVAHSRGIPLIVDEAHGAHFHFGEEFPTSALELGADIVIQSVHKTLPCFTQTALMHLKKGYVDPGRIEEKLQIFQSSSPSYLFMAGIEQCIRFMDSSRGKEQMRGYSRMLKQFMENGKKWRCLELMDDRIKEEPGVFDRDMSKILISVVNAPIDGVELAGILRKRYHIELEMASCSYGLAMTSLMDTGEGFDRLYRALDEIDKELAGKKNGMSGCKQERRGMELPESRAVELPEEIAKKRNGMPGCKPERSAMELPKGIVKMKMSDVPEDEGRFEAVPFVESAGRICGEFITVYPPGIPVVAPGELLTERIINLIETDRRAGLSVEGMRDESGQTVRVVRED